MLSRGNQDAFAEAMKGSFNVPYSIWTSLLLSYVDNIDGRTWLSWAYPATTRLVATLRTRIYAAVQGRPYKYLPSLTYQVYEKH